MTDAAADDLGEVIELTREGVIRSAKKLQALLERMEQRLEDLTMKGSRDTRGMQQAMTAYGIMIDKVPILLRTLRSLEAESVDDIGTEWRVVVREEE